MTKSKPLVEKITPLISDTMGSRVAEVFYKFYEYEDDDEVLAGAKAILYDLVGPKMAERKLKEFLK